MRRTLEADYVVVGAGAVGMAFTDEILTHTDATVILADRRSAPGGHWNEAYPFVRLHSPSLNYGVNSAALGDERIDRSGFNAGFLELATGAEICAYYERLMRRRFMESGRVTWLPLHEVEGGVATPVLGGEAKKLIARRKTVDAGFAQTRTAASSPPAFPVERGVRLLPPSGVAVLGKACRRFVILGAGKTAMDVVVFLLEAGIVPDAICWVRPRDAWLLPRERMQPSHDDFDSVFGGLADEMEVSSIAASMPDLFVRLEAAGLLLRIDESVEPTMYRCAIVSRAELALLRSVRDVVRMGHVKAATASHLLLDGGRIEIDDATAVIDCTADGIPKMAPQPIFAPGRIVLQYVRRCSPTFSAAFIGLVEATEPEARKNALCTPVPAPDEPADWARMLLAESAGRRLWSQSPKIGEWLLSSRLDRFAAMTARAADEGDPGRLQTLARFRAALQPGLSNLDRLLSESGAR